mgnify:FL=1
MSKLVVARRALWAHEITDIIPHDDNWYSVFETDGKGYAISAEDLGKLIPW